LNSMSSDWPGKFDRVALSEMKLCAGEYGVGCDTGAFLT
jgi:hypothetical protein